MTTVTPEPVGTERLRLLPVEPGHADEMAGVLADPALYAFTGGAPPSREALRERYERQAAGSPEPGVTWGNWVIQVRRTGQLAGYVQATITARARDAASPPGPEAEVAWVVGTVWQGQGLATEAARALAGWLDRHGVTTIVAHIHPDHHASTAVATALGLSPSGGWHDGERRWQRGPAP
jgi:RimJ/RimL family protein N-acetyltransferase